jgi:hypothetical protein
MISQKGSALAEPFFFGARLRGATDHGVWPQKKVQYVDANINWNSGL